MIQYRNRLKRTNLRLSWGEGWREGIVREFGMDMCTLLYLKWITNKDLFIAHGTSLNVMWQPGLEGTSGENGYMAESL